MKYPRFLFHFPTELIAIGSIMLGLAVAIGFPLWFEANNPVDVSQAGAATELAREGDEGDLVVLPSGHVIDDGSGDAPNIKIMAHGFNTDLSMGAIVMNGAPTAFRVKAKKPGLDEWAELGVFTYLQVTEIYENGEEVSRDGAKWSTIFQGAGEEFTLEEENHGR